MKGQTFKKWLAGFLAAVCLPFSSFSVPTEVRAADLAADVSASVSGNTVSIGNGYISREFSIAGNKLSTAKITNKRTDGEATVFTPGEGSEEFKIRMTKKAHPAIDKSGWTATADSYQDERVESGIDGNAGALIDNDTATIWHTKYNGNGQNGAGSTNLPYNVVFNLGKSTAFQCFSLTPRQGRSDGAGVPKAYTLYYSTSSSGASLAVDDASWQELASGEFSVDTEHRKQVYVNLDQACTATQLKLKITSSYSDVYINAAEFDLHAEKVPETEPTDEGREFAASDLTLSGEPVIENTEAIIQGKNKIGKKVTFHFAPYTFQDVEYTINEVVVMYDGDHFMRKYMEISVPDNQKEEAVIDYIDLESLVTNSADAKWTIPTDAGGVVQMEQYRANLGQPIYIQGMFFGCEFPLADNEISSDGTGYMRYYSGKSFERLGLDSQLTKDGKYVTWQTVAGAARSTENEVIQADFFEYIKSIATPSEFRIQYNSWFDNMMRISDEKILSSFIEMDRELNRAGVRPLDSYAVDDGWINYNDTHVEDEVRTGTTLNESGFWEFNSKFPNGLKPSSDLVHTFGSNFGVWVGPRGGYNFYGSLANIMVKSGKGSKAGGSIDVADRTYVKHFTEMTSNWMKDYGVNYWKWDGFADNAQYNEFAAADGVPGYANRHMTGGYQHMYHVTDLWEAWIDLMETLREREKEYDIKKLWISLTCYTNPSPWFLQWANSVWIQCIHDQADAGFSQSKMDRQMTYRDAVYYDFLKNHQFQFPLSNVYNHDPIYGEEGTGMKIDSATDEQFQNYLYMQSTRGPAFWELLFSDSIMTEGKYQVTDEFLEWAEENNHMLKNSKMFGESPNSNVKLSSVSEGETNAYGYSCFDGTDGLISFRNPATTTKSVTITFDRTLGVPEGAGTLKYHMEHSHNLTNGTPTTGELVYGQEYTITLQPDEVRILRVSKDGDIKAPEIARVYSEGGNKVVVKFNEKVKGGTFKINGKAVTAELSADDRTFLLTVSAEALSGADILTLTAEGVTDLAGNALTDNERVFRYYSDNAVASKGHHQVTGEECLANDKDSLAGSNGFSVKTEIATGSTGQVIRQGAEYELGIGEDGTANFTLNGVTASSKTKVNDGYAHSVIGVKENNGMLKIYVDGVVEGSAYKAENKYYDVQAADIMLGNENFYGNVKAAVYDVAAGYDEVADENGTEVPSGEQNWALNKTVTVKWKENGNDAAGNSQRPAYMAVDGTKNSSANHVQFGDDNKKESAYVQVDFGSVRSVSKVNLYRYWDDSRIYDATVIALSESEDFSNPEIVYNSDENDVHGFGEGTDATYAETSAGKTFELDAPYSARYIRVYMYGSNQNNTNHIVELEAIGDQSLVDADYSAVNRAKEMAQALIDNHTAHSEWYTEDSDFNALQDAVAAIEEGKKSNEQAAVNKMAADIINAASKIKETGKKKLQNTLDQAEQKETDDYTPESVAKYEAALAEAKTVFASQNATEEQLTAALAKVTAAQKALVTLLSAAKKDLDSAIEDAEKVERDPAHAEENWVKFQEALANARKWQKRPVTASEPNELSDVAEELQSALNELKKDKNQAAAAAAEKEAAAAAKRELGTSLKAAEAYKDSFKYTKQSWEAFQSALKEAQRLQNSATSKKAELDQAKADLDKAIKDLKPAQVQQDKDKQDKDTIEQGKSYTVGNYKYKVTSLSGKTVEVVGILNAKSARSIVIGDTVTLADKASYQITSIGADAFKNCVKATKLIIGKKVVKIGNKAFYGCKKLTSAKINSAQLTSIGSQAFANCKKLKTITIKSKKLKTVGKNAFKNIGKTATIKVPSSKLKTYKSKILAKKGQSKQVKIKK